MWSFLNRNSGGIQALAGFLTVLLALAALLGVKFQIDAADRIQRAQSARDIYREYLNVAINKPEFAKPDYCALAPTQQGVAYEHFVEYMLYTAEQTIAADADWQVTFGEALKPHAKYICSLDDVDGYSASVNEMLRTFKIEECAAHLPCN